jgi:hypothetical protein
MPRLIEPRGSMHSPAARSVLVHRRLLWPPCIGFQPLRQGSAPNPLTVASLWPDFLPSFIRLPHGILGCWSSALEPQYVFFLYHSYLAFLDTVLWVRLDHRQSFLRSGAAGGSPIVRSLGLRWLSCIVCFFVCWCLFILSLTRWLCIAGGALQFG